MGAGEVERREQKKVEMEMERREELDKEGQTLPPWSPVRERKRDRGVPVRQRES